MENLETSINESKPLVSVYTCVYNGARTLHRVFESMKELTYPNIEHVIVNDGSTDNTEELINDYIQEVSYPVKYYKKENGGKHTALNVAWEIAGGEFLVQLDADDKLLPDSISFLVDTYYSIPESIRDEYWCVHGRCVTQNGKFVGDPYPDDINDSNWKEAGSRAAKCRGDKLGLQLRKVLSQYRFPEPKGVPFVFEGVIWGQINKKFGTWYTNEITLIYYVNEGGNLTAKKTRRTQFSASAFYAKWRISHPDLYGKASLKDLVKYSLCYFVAPKSYKKSNKYLKDIKKHKISLALIYPAMFFVSKLFMISKHIK